MIKDNTTTNAYDSFGQELFTGDTVVCSIPRYIYGNSGTFILCKGIVESWTKKRINVRITEVQSNTDLSHLENWSTLRIGEIQQLKPDKIYKIK